MLAIFMHFSHSSVVDANFQYLSVCFGVIKPRPERKECDGRRERACLKHVCGPVIKVVYNEAEGACSYLQSITVMN